MELLPTSRQIDNAHQTQSQDQSLQEEEVRSWINPDVQDDEEQTAENEGLRRNLATTDTRAPVETGMSSRPHYTPSSSGINTRGLGMQSRRASVFRGPARRESPPQPDEISTHIPPCPKCCRPLLRSSYQTSAKPKLCERFRDAILCPPQGQFHKCLLYVIISLMGWAILWGMTGNAMLPHGVGFLLWVLEVGGIVAGVLFNFTRLPPLLGMLIFGVFVGNFPLPFFQVDDSTALQFWFGAVRCIALGIILTRAGLGLNPTALRRLKFVCFRLAFIPCLVECGTATIVAHFLMDFPWLWALMLGFALAAVSPAVVVPGMLIVQKKNLSILKGLPTLLIASSSIDDVLAIGGFGIVMSITFSKGNLIMTIFHGPLEIVVGVVYGLCVGLMLWYIPDPLFGRDLLLARIVLLFLASMVSMFFFRGFELSGAGALGTIIVSFVCACSWREDYRSSSGLREVSFHFARLWLLVQPLMFGLVGAEMLISDIELSTIGFGTATICICLVMRGCTAACVVFGCEFNMKEHLFIALAWMPKATVQAAVGPIPLDYVRSHDLGPELEELAKKLLQVVTLAILICAPLGAACIALTASCLLTHDPPAEEDKVDEHVLPMSSDDVSRHFLHASRSETRMLSQILVKTEEYHDAVNLPVPEPETPVPPRTPSEEYMHFLGDRHVYHS